MILFVAGMDRASSKRFTAQGRDLGIKRCNVGGGVNDVPRGRGFCRVVTIKKKDAGVRFAAGVWGSLFRENGPILSRQSEAGKDIVSFAFCALLSTSVQLF